MKKITFIAALLCSAFGFAQFSESFEGGTTVPAGWTVLNGGDANTWTIINFSGSTEISAHTGTNAAGIGYGSTAHDDFLVTPSITVTAGVNDYLSFWGRSRDPLYPEIIDVKVSTTTATAAAFTTTLLAAVAPPSGASFVKYGIDLSGYVGQTVYIGFHSTTTDMFYFDIDDVVSEALPSCPEPNGVNVTDITEGGAIINWAAVGFANDFQIEYGPAGFTPGTGTTLAVTGAVTTTLGPLDASTAYDVYVRTDCGGGEYSGWVQVSFTTEATPAENDACEDATALTVYNTFEAGLVTANNIGATVDAAVPSCQANVLNDVWFSVVVPEDGNLTVETSELIGSDNTDTVLVAYSGTCGSLVAIDCDDDDGVDFFSKLELTGLEAGSTIYIAVYQYSSVFFPSTPGAFQISVYNTALANTQFDASQFAYHPNPMKDVLNISNKEVISNVTIYDLLGQQVLSNNVGAADARIDVSMLAQGQYLAKVTSGGATKTVKLLKQ